MAIFTKRFNYKWTGKCLLDDVLNYLKKRVGKKTQILRFAIVEVKNKTLVIDASLEEL